jgi:translation initiation factor IF-3
LDSTNTDSIFNISVNRQPGFNLGIVSSWNINENIHVRFIPSMDTQFSNKSKENVTRFAWKYDLPIPKTYVYYNHKNANKFLAKGDRVKVVVRFRGRQLGHTDIGRQVLLKFIEATSELSVVDKRPKMEGRQMVMFLNSKI